MKNLTVTFVFLFLSITINAQSLHGVRVAFSSAQFNYQLSGSKIDTENIHSVYSAYMIAFQLKKKFFIKTGLSYAPKGYQQTSENNPFANDKLKLNYLEIPVLAFWKIPIKEQFRFFVGVGPSIAYALSGKFKIAGEQEPFDLFEEEENFNRFDMGLMVDLGFSYVVGPGEFSLFTNGSAGFINLLKNDIGLSLTNQNRLFGISYMLYFGNKEFE